MTQSIFIQCIPVVLGLIFVSVNLSGYIEAVAPAGQMVISIKNGNFSLDRCLSEMGNSAIHNATYSSCGRVRLYAPSHDDVDIAEQAARDGHVGLQWKKLDFGDFQICSVNFNAQHTFNTTLCYADMPASFHPYPEPCRLTYGDLSDALQRFGKSYPWMATLYFLEFLKLFPIFFVFYHIYFQCLGKFCGTESLCCQPCTRFIAKIQPPCDYLMNFFVLGLAAALVDTYSDKGKSINDQGCPAEVQNLKSLHVNLNSKFAVTLAMSVLEVFCWPAMSLKF